MCLLPTRVHMGQHFRRMGDFWIASLALAMTVDGHSHHNGVTSRPFRADRESNHSRGSPKRLFPEGFQGDLGRPVCARKIFRFAVTPNQWLPSFVPHSQRGALRDRHERWARDAMDVAASAQSLRRRIMLQRTAKSCGPGAPTLALSERNDPLMTGARKPGPRGDHV
jgi:hypothetical protein